MVKVISDWERLGAGAGMVNKIVDDDDNDETEPPEYKFLDRDGQKFFLRVHPPHDQEKRTTLTPTTMPHYVNMDGSKTVESNND